MTAVRACELPPGSLIEGYRSSGAYADCFAAEVPFPVSHADFVEAFYTTALFKLERLILAWAISRPSTDAEAAQLGRGERETFAAWTVESRATNEVLLRGGSGRTCSWLMVAPTTGGTQLFFGSAVVAKRNAETGEARMGSLYTALLGFHRLYSRALLASARARLVTGRNRKK